MQLGDLFPDDLKKAVIEDKLLPGSIIHFYCNQINKPKFSVIVSISSEGTIGFATVFINSKKDPYENHILISPNDYSFLTHDSHICCSDLQERTKEELLNIISKTQSSYKGKVADNVLAEIKTKLSAAKTISKTKKKKYGL